MCSSSAYWFAKLQYWAVLGVMGAVYYVPVPRALVFSTESFTPKGVQMLGQIDVTLKSPLDTSISQVSPDEIALHPHQAHLHAGHAGSRRIEMLPTQVCVIQSTNHLLAYEYRSGEECTYNMNPCTTCSMFPGCECELAYQAYMMLF